MLGSEIDITIVMCQRIMLYIHHQSTRVFCYKLDETFDELIWIILNYLNYIWIILKCERCFVVVDLF